MSYATNRIINDVFSLFLVLCLSLFSPPGVHDLIIFAVANDVLFIYYLFFSFSAWYVS